NDPESFGSLQQGDVLECKGIKELISSGAVIIPVQAGSSTIECRLDISSRQREIILAGGLLNYTRLKSC
ncbi:MAG: hypothetical protein LWW97_12250, partial [Deltaproteobacteria bacterium]|nr:hypothetical protein [Deltaproteobacteria bacterium]